MATVARPWPRTTWSADLGSVRGVTFGLAAAAWAVLGATAAASGHVLFCGEPGIGQLRLRLDALVSTGVPGAEMRTWTLMVAAMMLPVAAPMIGFVHSRSARRRQGRTATLFAASYLATWTLAGCIVVPIALLSGALIGMTGGATVVRASAFAAAALFQLSRSKAKALNRCHGTMALRTYGHAADRDALRFGAVHALRCARACWPAMGALALAGHSLPAMVLVTVAIVRERRAFRPSGVEAAWLLALAGAVAAATA